MVDIRKTFDQIGFGGAFSLGLIDQRHILINFDHENDFQRCWLRQTWSIKGALMRVFKWSPDFRPEIESPVVPVWIAFEGLPAHLQDKRAIYSIANLIGPPLKVVASTLTHNRPSLARVCVELNVSTPLTEQIWINNGSFGGFMQKVSYEFVPPYCLGCQKFGHLSPDCRAQMKGRKDPRIEPMPSRQPQIVPPRKRWRLIEQETAHRSVDPPANPAPDPPAIAPKFQPDDRIQDTDSSTPQVAIPDANAFLGDTVIDDQSLLQPSQSDSQPGHLSEGDEAHDFQAYSQSLLESWKEDSKQFASKLGKSQPDDFITVTKKKRRPREDYSVNVPAVTTRFAAGKIARVSFSHRLK
ncbi:PREDICTED: uncharacterized protein LOC109170991 [Ipomoea nil]|uniref:uncharacterized protein LOC109170991 n=1 Tax=Ipomoea nil TaxID=35883 RepID=UPI000901CAD5|nr:PREDICTED: uncharacterized protein LOC109170991 [Ipomoea nil]